MPQTIGRTRLGKTGFQIEGSGLIHNITEDRLRHASGSVRHHQIRYINTVFKTTTLFNHSTLLYKVVQGHLVSVEHKRLSKSNHLKFCIYLGYQYLYLGLYKRNKRLHLYSTVGVEISKFGKFELTLFLLLCHKTKRTLVIINLFYVGPRCTLIPITIKILISYRV